MCRRSSECHVVGRAARLGAAFALIVAGLGIGGCAGAGKDAQAAEERASADKFYEVAVGSFQNGMYSDAERNLDRALNIDDAHANALYLRGLISLVEGKDVLTAVERSSCLRDEAAELQRERASELHRASREFFRRAAASFGEGSAGRGRALNSMAVVSLYFGDYETAVLEAEEALEEQFYAARYSALSNLGWAYYQQDRVVEAMAELREAVRMNPDHCVSRYRLAETYFRYGLADEAQALVEGIVGEDACPIQEAFSLHGDILRARGDEDAAKAAYHSCASVAPRSCVAESCRGRLGQGMVAAQ